MLPQRQGRVFATDSWDTQDTLFDGQWATENARREVFSFFFFLVLFSFFFFLLFRVAPETWS